MATLYTVLYRTGGSVRFTWHRAMAYESRGLAETVREATERMGYAAHVVEHAADETPDLPTTFEYDPACRYCGAPRPAGYASTCGRSECQEQDHHDTMARARRGRKGAR